MNNEIVPLEEVYMSDTLYYFLKYKGIDTINEMSLFTSTEVSSWEWTDRVLLLELVLRMCDYCVAFKDKSFTRG